MSEAQTPQAQPVDGRTFPATARGARPTFFDDDGATDAVLAIVTALAAEVWTLRERIAGLEALLTAAGTIAADDVDNRRIEPDEAEARSAEASAFIGRVFRVLDEMREETAAGETQERYLAVVQRAFEEI